MEGFVGRRDLLAREELQALSGKSDLAGALQLGSHVVALVATSWLITLAWGTAWMLLPILLQGMLLNWLYCAQHELSHGTVFRTRWLNEAVGRVIGFLQLYPRDFDQIQHFGHHRHTGDWEKDPELQRDPYELPGYLLWFSGASYWYSRVTRLWRLTFGHVVEPYIRDDEKPRVMRGPLARGALQPGRGRLHRHGSCRGRLLAGPDADDEMGLHAAGHDQASRPAAQQRQPVLRTRARRAPASSSIGSAGTCSTIPAHHLFPSVPFHRLPRLHDAIVAKAGRSRRPWLLRIPARDADEAREGASAPDYPDEAVWIEPSR